MVGNDGLRNPETRNDVVEDELSSCFTIVRKCRHRFSPLGEVVDNDDYIRMPLGRMRVTRHKVHAPFRKRADGNNKMQRERWRAHLALKHLARMTLTDCNDTVLEY